MIQVESLDVEMGIDKGNLRKPNQITRFKNIDLVKWVILQVKLIQKRCVHFPLILIFCLLCSDAYPDILSATYSLIISLVITFIICLKKQSWIIRFKNTNMVKWFILQVKLIPKRFIHFPLILICSLLCSAAYPNILPAINSLIISLVITFVVCLKGPLY